MFDDNIPHCYMPIHVWLDKGLVSRTAKKHPMIIRAAWLPHEIRNGSGNGGGILVAYIPVVSMVYTSSHYSFSSHYRLRIHLTPMIRKSVVLSVRCFSNSNVKYMLLLPRRFRSAVIVSEKTEPRQTTR